MLDEGHRILGCDNLQPGRKTSGISEEPAAHIFRLLSRKKQVHPKGWCLSTRLYGVTSQKSVLYIVTAVTTSNTMTLHDFPSGKVSKRSVKCILASVYYCILFLGNTKIQYAILNNMYIQIHVLSLQHYLNSADILPYLEVH